MSRKRTTLQEPKKVQIVPVEDGFLVLDSMTNQDMAFGSSDFTSASAASRWAEDQGFEIEP